MSSPSISHNNESVPQQMIHSSSYSIPSPKKKEKPAWQHTALFASDKRNSCFLKVFFLESIASNTFTIKFETNPKKIAERLCPILTNRHTIVQRFFFQTSIKHLSNLNNRLRRIQLRFLFFS